MFRDRHEAGERLAESLLGYVGDPDVIVLGIPRGGVVVAAAVARALKAPLDVALAAKVGAPGNPEYAIGAVAEDGLVIANPSAGVALGEVQRNSNAAVAKLQGQALSVRRGAPAPDLAKRTVILVDDGLATGLTAVAAADWVRRQGAGRLVVAVPVASRSAVDLLSAHADEVISVDIPPMFMAVGQFYQDFGQTEDAEVEALLADSKEAHAKR